jgi:hypothetical protein
MLFDQSIYLMQLDQYRCYINRHFLSTNKVWLSLLSRLVVHEHWLNLINLPFRTWDKPYAFEACYQMNVSEHITT